MVVTLNYIYRNRKKKKIGSRRGPSHGSMDRGRYGAVQGLLGFATKTLAARVRSEESQRDGFRDRRFSVGFLSVFFNFF